MKKRVADGKIIVCQTDKSGRRCVMPMELYIEVGDTHVSKDMVVDDKFVRGTQIKCLNMGESWEHTDRLRQTQINHSCLVPPLYLLIKDHKKYSGSGPPPARPVCGAVNGMDVHLSNILSHIIESVADEMKNKIEIISTDDGLSKSQFQTKQCDEVRGPLCSGASPRVPTQ